LANIKTRICWLISSQEKNREKSAPKNNLQKLAGGGDFDFQKNTV